MSARDSNGKNLESATIDLEAITTGTEKWIKLGAVCWVRLGLYPNGYVLFKRPSMERTSISSPEPRDRSETDVEVFSMNARFEKVFSGKFPTLAS